MGDDTRIEIAESSVVRATNEYNSAAVNKHENNIHTFKDWVVYSRGNCLALAKPTSTECTTFLKAHTMPINGHSTVVGSCSQDSIIHMISSSYDSSAIIWAVKQENSVIDYKVIHTLSTPSGQVFTARSSVLRNEDYLSFTGSLDGDMVLWRNEKMVKSYKEDYTCLYSHIHKITVDDNAIDILSLACSDSKIRIYQILDEELLFLIELTGNKDWVKCLDTLDLPQRGHEFLLAAACQDNYVRVWQMKLVDEGIKPNRLRTISKVSIKTNEANQDSFKLMATLETVLQGHQKSVIGLCWFQNQSDDALRLVSCSYDKTLIIWSSKVAEPEIEKIHPQNTSGYIHCPTSAGVWIQEARFGETGETNLPFLGVCVSEDNQSVFAHSLRGAIHHWTKSDEIWSPDLSITGHAGPVTDLAWERSGAYLLSVSLDKTCRMHAVASKDNHWRELARPQVHGHEINCIASLGFGKFATGSDEKTIRTYGATQYFVRSFKALAMAPVPEELLGLITELPAHAQLPALGLTIRGSQNSYDLDDPNDENASNAWYARSSLVEELAKKDHLDSIPFEEILLQSTLWWESNKLYGHGNELFSLATDSSFNFMASASKANKLEFANIIIWETKNFRKCAEIYHHTLTIIKLKFSPDDQYLLSISRDRTWCLSRKTGQLREAYEKFFGTDKSNSVHERIIWDCAWTNDSRHFVTVGRDKRCCLWSVERVSCSSDDSGDPQRNNGLILCRMLDQVAQAIDIFNHQVDGRHLTALGYENGDLTIEVFATNSSEPNWQVLRKFEKFHQTVISKLAFRPSPRPNDIMLASGGLDQVVTLTNLEVIISNDGQQSE